MNWKCILLLAALPGIASPADTLDHESHGCEAGFGFAPELVSPRESLSRQSESSFPKPPVVSRTAWGCPDGQSSRWSPQYTTVTHLIVHHSAGSNSSSDWRATVRGIWNYHALDRGWGDIGYNYLIDPNGVIYEGRAGGDNVVAAHFSCRNGGTFGVCLLGDFSARSPTAAALTSLKKLLAWKADQLNLDPEAAARHAGTGLNLYRISGHRNGNDAYPDNACTTTSCPGNVLYNLLPQIRQDVQDLINPPLPSTQTLAAGDITANSAILRGSVSDAGASGIVERRFEWARAAVSWGAGVPGVDSGVIYHAAIAGPDSGFEALLGNLQPCTSYKYRVYARNAEGWSDPDSVNIITFSTASTNAGLRLEGLIVLEEQTRLRVTGPCGATIVVEKSADLESWAKIYAGPLRSDGAVLVEDATGTDGTSAFYRAREVD